MDGVKLRFTKGALQAVASDAQKHKSGARGLRAILEQAMLDIMFEVPTNGTPVREVVINEETIQKGQQPLFMYQKGRRRPESDRRRDLHCSTEGFACPTHEGSPGARLWPRRPRRRSTRWVAWMPLLFVAAFLYWSVALGLGGLSLMAASAISGDVESGGATPDFGAVGDGAGPGPRLGRRRSSSTSRSRPSRRTSTTTPAPWRRTTPSTPRRRQSTGRPRPATTGPAACRARAATSSERGAPREPRAAGRPSKHGRKQTGSSGRGSNLASATGRRYDCPCACPTATTRKRGPVAFHCCRCGTSSCSRTWSCRCSSGARSRSARSKRRWAKACPARAARRSSSPRSARRRPTSRSPRTSSPSGPSARSSSCCACPTGR